MVPFAHRTTATALPGGRIELVVPELCQGEEVEIIILPLNSDWDGCDAADAFIATSKGILSRAEVETMILHEREAWEG